MDDFIDAIAKGEVEIGLENPTSNHALTRSLGCCEYVRASDGKVRSVLQCFCECNDVDETMDRLITQGQVPSRSQIRRIEEDIADRFRLPWIDGAIKINPWVVLVPLVLCLERLLIFFTRALLPGVFVLMPIITFAYFLYASVTLMKDADSARSKMHSSFTSWVIAQVVREYFFVLRSGVHPILDIFACLLVVIIVLASAYIQCGDPGRLGHVKPPTDTSKHGLAKYYVSNGLLRAKYCYISESVIEHYDHFCIWLGSPIGKHNHLPFLVFLLAVSTGGFLFCWKSFSVSGASDAVTSQLFACATRALLGASGCALLLGKQCYLISMGITTYESLHRKDIVSQSDKLGSNFPRNVWGRPRWRQIWVSFFHALRTDAKPYSRRQYE